MPDVFWTGIGSVAAALTSLSFIPQVLKMWKSQSVADVSPVTFIQFSCGAILWAAYGIHRQDLVVIGANLVVLVTLLAALTLYYRHKLSPIQQFVLATMRGAQAVGGDASIAVRDSTHGLVKAMEGNGGDIVQVAKEAVQGAMNGARATGMKQEAAVSAATVGVIEAAEEINAEVAQRVKEVVSA